MSQLDDLVIELTFFFEPATTAATDKDALAGFLRRFGYDVHAPDLDGAVASLSSSVANVFGDAPALPGAAGMVPVAEQLFGLLQIFGDNPDLASIVDEADDFALEVFDYLCYRYLSTRVPAASAVLKALGVIVLEPVAPNDQGGREIAYERLDLRWDRLGDFLRDNRKWAQDVYAWGGDPARPGRVFEHEKAIDAIIHVLEATRLALAHKRPLDAGEAAVFLANTGAETVFEAALPFLQHDLEYVEDGGEPVFASEAGLKVVPFGDRARPQGMGLALTPYAKGSVTSTHQLTERLALELSGAGTATGGAYVTLTPDGIDVALGGAVDAGFEFGFRWEDDGCPLLLLGSPDGTRLEADGILLSVGGNLSGDFFIAGGVEGLLAAIDVGEDGFLGALIPAPLEVTAGDLLIGWRTGRGVYFEGGTSLGVTVPLDLALGPVTLTEVGLRLDWEEDVRITFLASGDARLGPLFAAVEEMGLVATLVPREDGNGTFGRYDLAFGFRPPTGYAIALEAPAIQGGGYLAALDDEYRGALALTFESFSLAAFGILTTRLPDGSEGFSFVASIFGEFTLPLGFGFFLTGVGGVVGINRTVDTEALRTVLLEGRMDSLLFPSDPIANADTILDDLASVFPAREGHHVFGPMARIGWGQPVLVQGTLGVIVELGDNLRILILGGLQAILPTEDAALIALKLSFFGEIDFAGQTLSFDASLQGSRIVSWPVSGDVAVRSGWAPRLNHIASFGGLHPRYPQPANLPDLRRLSIAFGTNNPRVTLSAYAAVTLNSLQFGARADLYAKGPKIPFVGRCAAEGWAYFDALIYFNPFGFDVALGGGLELLVDGDVIAGLGFDLRLTGPNTFHIDGKVWVTIFGMDIDFRISHRWGDKQSLPVETADPVQVLRQALQAARGFEPVPARNLTAAVAFASSDDAVAAIDPVGGARFVQRAVPLDVRLEKLGEARLAGEVDRLDLAVYEPSGSRVETEPARLEFALSQFRDLSDAEKLRAPAFENHDAGFEVASGALVVDAALAVEADYAYEVIEIQGDDERDVPAMIRPHRDLELDFTVRWARAHRAVVAEPPDRFPGRLPPPDPIVVRDVVFVAPEAIPRELSEIALPDGGSRLSELAGVTRSVSASFTVAQDLRAGVGLEEQLLADVNPVMAGYAAVGGRRR